MIKKFISYYKPHKKLFFIDITCAFAIAMIDLVFPMMTRHIIDKVIPNGDMRTLYIMIAVLGGLYIIRAAFNYVVDYWGHVVGVRMEYDMRKDIFSHLQTLSLSYFDKVRTGQLMSKIINDLREISELAHHGPEDIFLSFIMLIGSFIILLGVEWRLTLILFAFIPIMVWFAINRRKNMSKAFKSVKKRIADVNAQLENSISGIRVSKSFTNEEYEMEKFDAGNVEFKESREDAYKAMAQFFTGIQFLSSVLNLIVVGVGGIFAIKGLITIGDLTAYLLYVGVFLQPIKRLTQFTQQFESGMAGFERFYEVMNIKSDIVENKEAVDLENIKGNVKFENVTFSYDDEEPILSNINLTVEAGKTLALVGPSGGGKTTLCHLIPRFYDVDRGEISIDNENIKNITVKSLRENIGLVQQDIFLFTGTIKDNILYGNPEATDEEVIEAAKKANIHKFITKLADGYNTYIGEKGIRLSGGQKQRISIARVFLKNPPILILDEATSALDNETEIMIQKSLEELSVGRTTIVIAHRLSTIKNADEIVVLTDKGIREQGNHEELIGNKGLYAKLYKAQFKGYIPDRIA